MLGIGQLGDKFSTSAQKLITVFPKIKKVVKKTRTPLSASHHQIQGKMWNGEKFIKAKMLDITHIIDRVGTGDAFASGLIYGLLHYDEETALNFATAACALKHTV